MKRLRIVSLLLAIAMLLLAGCGATPTSKPEPSNSAPAAGGSSDKVNATPTKETLKTSIAFAGGKTALLWLPSAFAAYNNFYKEESVEVELIDVKGGSEAAQALISGQVDFASMALEQAIKSKAQGVDLVIVDTYTRYPGLVLVVDSKLKDQVKSVSDLKGMKVGVTSLGSGSHKVLLSLMNQAGMKPSDIEAIPTGPTGQIAAMESGKIQAGVNADPHVTSMVTSGKTFVVWDGRTKKDTEALYGNDYPQAGLVTRRELLEKNPELVERVVKAVSRANKFIASNSPETIASKLPAEIKGQDEALYLASLRAGMDSFSPDGVASDKGLQTIINSLKQDGIIPATMEIKPSDVFDARFLAK